MDAPEHIALPGDSDTPESLPARLGLADPVVVHHKEIELTMSCAEALELAGALTAIVRGRFGDA